MDASYLGYVDGYVKHGHQRHGLGNVLFMINAALSCGAEPILVNTTNVIFGTANAFGRRMQPRPYTSTLLSRFTLAQSKPKRIGGALRGGAGPLAPIPTCPNASSFTVRTFGQSPHFAASAWKLVERLVWPPTAAEISAKYPGIERGTCVGVRAGRDFAHRPISASQYARALAYLRSVGESTAPLFVLADVPRAQWAPLLVDASADAAHATQIAEDDVTQLAIGRRCRNFVVSQSSFHVWLAYVAIAPQWVIAFNGSDPHHTGILSPPWFTRPWVLL